MDSIIIKNYKFNIFKGIALLVLSFIIYANNRIGYNYFVYVMGGSAILSGFIHLAAGVKNQKETIENIYLVIVGLISIGGSIGLMFYLNSSYPYYSNKVMFSFWMLIQIAFTTPYLFILSKRDKNQFLYIALFIIGLIVLTVRSFLNNKSSFGIQFTIMPFAFVGIINLYVFLVCKKNNKCLR